MTAQGTERPSERARALVRRHGWNATAFQTLEGDYRHFFDGDGCIAYVDTGAAWVVAGAPICPVDELGPMARAFVLAATKAGRRACFFATEERFLHATAAESRSISIGVEPVYDPQEWTKTLAQSAGLREQLRRARAKGVVVRRVTSADLDVTRAAMDALVKRWFATRPMPPMGFLVEIGRTWADADRQCFVAERDGVIVGLARVVPVPQRSGWFIEHLLRDPHAPNGTVESLFDAVMRWAAGEGSAWLTLGLAPLAGDVPWALRLARENLAFLYDFRGLEKFKAKLRPSAWCPIYVTYPESQSAVATMIDVLAAFSRVGFLRFGIRAVLRGPRVVIALLAALLVPWTLMLAALPVRYFGSFPVVKWGWVAFDVALFVGLVRLIRRPSTRLASILAIAITADAVTTLIEAVCWNLPNAGGWSAGGWSAGGYAEALGVAVACLAPASAAVVLWGMRARLVRLERLEAS